MISGVEDDFMDPVMQCTTLPSHLRSLKRFLFHFSQRTMHFYKLAHSESVDIEKVVYELIIKKDTEMKEEKIERKSITLKAKKESSDKDNSDSEIDDEKCHGDVLFRNFKKFFKRRDPNHLIGDYPMPPRTKRARAFVGGSWNNNDNEEDEKTKDETCLMTQTSNEDIAYAKDRLRASAVDLSAATHSNQSWIVHKFRFCGLSSKWSPWKQRRRGKIHAVTFVKKQPSGVEVKREHLISIVGDMLNPEKLLLDAAEKLPTSHSSAA
ncbi:hypothetical protein Tco_0661919 [Tanacetum coccineum]